MKITQLKEKYRLPESVINALKGAGCDTLYPPQEEAIRSGVLAGKNLVLAIPTAAGKTLIAEMCMLTSILNAGGRCLYVVPLRALASEKYEDFRRKYSPLGVSVGIATGEYDAPSSRLARHHILIATSEKVDSLLRHGAQWLAKSLTVAVLDEIHYIHDASRGPTLEIVAARLRQVNPGLQILALSATISNGKELAQWLNAELISSDWRPVPLIEGVYSDNEIFYSDFTRKSLVGDRSLPVIALVTDTLRDGGQVLVFVNSRRSTRAVARSLVPHVHAMLSKQDKKELADLSMAALTVLTEPTGLCHELAKSIRSGVAFHHAGLYRTQRKIIEDAFRMNQVKVICATPTLAAGVNLPARRVVIRDWRRYETGSGLKPIPVFEYKQFAGRAGRPGYDSLGEAILIAKKEMDRDLLFQNYVSASSEPLRSQLGSGGALASHILGAIAAGYATSIAGIMEFLSLTFFAFQGDVSYLSYAVKGVIRFLLEEELIYCHGGKTPGFENSVSTAPLIPTPGVDIKGESTELYPTAFGGTVSRLYLDPTSGTTIKKGLHACGGRAPSIGSLLHLICCCPDMPTLRVGKGVYEALSEEATLKENLFLVPCPKNAGQAERDSFLAALRTTHMIEAWISEKTEDFICEDFGVGPGDIHRFIDTADWLIYSAERIASLFDMVEAQDALNKLRRRVKYGIKKELLELASLKGIGRVRARNLYRNGYKTLAAIRKAGVKKLSSVPTIGPQTAEKIKKQLK